MDEVALWCLRPQRCGAGGRNVVVRPERCGTRPLQCSKGKHEQLYDREFHTMRRGAYRRERLTEVRLRLVRFSMLQLSWLRTKEKGRAMPRGRE